MIRHFARYFQPSTASDDLLRAQAAALSHQIPLLYVVLTINAWALAYTHFDSAPTFQTIYFPAVLSVFCIGRLIHWWRSRNAPYDRQRVIKRMRATTSLTFLLGVMFLAWALSMNHYDVISELDRISGHGHVAFFIGITVVSCAFLLMHLPNAALTLSTIISIPFVAYLMMSGHRIEMAIGVNLALVSFAMMYILLVSYNSFAQKVEADARASALSEENARLAEIDALTELPNRRQFFRKLNSVAHEPSEPGGVAAVGVMDLDGFKQVNDIYGHAIGDRLLIECARRLSMVSEDRAFIARLGGDEFGLVVHGQPDADSLVQIGEELCDALGVPFSLPGAMVSIGASVGFALINHHLPTAEEYYEHADYALYHAKQHRRGSVVVFSEDHQTEIKTTATIEQALRHADLDTEMSLRFQPIVNTVRNRVVAFEALARWTNPQLGFVSPGQFIPIAERSDLILRITRIMLGKALEAMKAWPEDVHISFNLSIRDIMASEQILALIQMVRDSGITPARITFEVTESGLVDEFEKAESAIGALKALGAAIALDDFGTGYSSLSYIHRLPLDKIKIDRSFVNQIETSDASRNIVRSIVGLCQMLNLTCVVEGMETEGQTQALRDLGCQIMQGYFFAKPMEYADACALIARRDEAQQQRA